jgi:hypothetical protein
LLILFSGVPYWHMLAVMPKQPSTPKRRRGRPSLPNALTMPLTVKINPAIYQGLLSINDDARIALRLVAILKLLEMNARATLSPAHPRVRQSKPACPKSEISDPLHQGIRPRMTCPYKASRNAPPLCHCICYAQNLPLA